MADVTGMLQAASGSGKNWNLDGFRLLSSPTTYCFGHQLDYSGGSGILGFFFKSDGTKFYATVYDSSFADYIQEYSCRTPWELAGAEYVTSVSITGSGNIYFRSDGLKLYTIDTGGDLVAEHTLSSAWNIATVSLTRTFSVNAQETNPYGLFFKPDGLKMYVCGTTGDDVNEYTLSTAWNISTASFTRTKSVAAQTTVPFAVCFNPTGTKMFVGGGSSPTNTVYEYTLSTAWNVSTASLTSSTADISPGASSLYSVAFNDDGTKIYVTAANMANAYTMVTPYSTASIASPPNALPTQYAKKFTQATSFAKNIFFKPDGTKAYVLDRTLDDIFEYTLSTPWDISTASYVALKAVDAQEASPSGFFIRSDGLKLYVIGTSGDEVNEYTLSSAWSISTASFTRVKSVSAQSTFPAAVWFKSDGTKMYVLGFTSVYEYALSTAWNVSTASYTDSFNFSADVTTYLGTDVGTFFFKPDGTRLYIIIDSKYVLDYSIATAWDVSTSTLYDARDFSTYVGSDSFLAFDTVGSKLYLCLSGSNLIKTEFRHAGITLTT